MTAGGFVRSLTIRTGAASHRRHCRKWRMKPSSQPAQGTSSVSTAADACASPCEHMVDIAVL